MVTAGIIAEYNPFHKGHQYHIEETRKKTNADYVIVVMSGDFVQRGEPAIADKYFRTELALKGGVDLVLEIPAVYATASAEYFATAGVKLLHQLHCVDYLSFGSEWASVDDYELYVQLLVEESPEYQSHLQEGLRQGKSFPLARMDALCQIMEKQGRNREEIKSFLSEPNHILGLEYMKSLRRLQSDIVPVTVGRRGAGYHEEKIIEGFPSATSLRLELKKGRSTIINGGMYTGAEQLVDRYMRGDFVQWEDLMPYLEYIYMTEFRFARWSDENNNLDYFGVDDEMCRRFSNQFQLGYYFEELIGHLHTKRLTDATWRRGLLHMVLKMKDYDFLKKAAEIPVPYARVLGFSGKATPLLKKIREKARLDVIQKPSMGRRLYPQGSIEAEIIGMDILAADLYEQIAAKKSSRKFRPELTRQQVIN